MRIIKARAWSWSSIPQSPRLLHCGINHKRPFILRAANKLEGGVLTGYLLRHHKMSLCFLMRPASGFPLKPLTGFRQRFLGLSLRNSLSHAILFITYDSISRHYLSLF
jgi:hypothetical protein